MPTTRLIVGAGKFTPKIWDDQFQDTLLDIKAFPNIDVVGDLNEEWPFADNNFHHVSALHVIEHLNSLVHFMDQAFRVIMPGGSLYIETPLAGGDIDLEWGDPTHRRLYRKCSFFNYFSPEGVNNFRYTDNSWNFINISDDNRILRVHGIPIKS